MLKIVLKYNVFLIVTITCLVPSLFQASGHELKSAWYERPPYQMFSEDGANRELTGLDIYVIQEICAEAGYSVSFEQSDWSSIMKRIRNGTIHITAGAYYDKNREEFAYYTKSYRSEHNAVYFHINQQKAVEINTFPSLFSYISSNPLRMATLSSIGDFYYGRQEVQDFLSPPPSSLHMIETKGYYQSLRMLAAGQVDFFIGNPVMADKIIADIHAQSQIIKAPLAFPDIPVHILLSKKHFTQAEVERFNACIKEMKERKRLRTLHIEFILPSYLSITTNKYWFNIITVLGIVSFCISGVLVARKERYNFFGALVLAILPAIGGGVSRDLILGTKQVFVIEEPMFMLIAITVVLVAFICFKSYDFYHTRDKNKGEKLGKFTEDRIGYAFGRLFMFFDAWAVATFTVIGVGVAVEEGATPLLLWGPLMGALTASGGVVLRDVVRADFNITMLKQDSYAEISIIGGFFYVAALMMLPSRVDMEFILTLTMVTITVLFLIRLFILHKGYDSPLQFGAPQTHPKLRTRRFEKLEPQLWRLLTRYWYENEQGRGIVISGTKRAELHNEYLYSVKNLRELLNLVAAEPLNEEMVIEYRQLSARLEKACALEENLYNFLKQTGGEKIPAGSKAHALLQSIHESLRILIDITYDAISKGEKNDFTFLKTMTVNHRERFYEVRAKYAALQLMKNDPSINTVLQATHTVERIIYLVGDYTRTRLNIKNKPTGVDSSRKSRRKYLS